MSLTLPKLFNEINMALFAPKVKVQEYKEMKYLIIVALSIVNIIAMIAIFLTSNRTYASVVNNTVRITNISDRAFTVSWFSSKPEAGTVSYGTEAGNLSSSATDDRGPGFSGTTHHVTVGLGTPLLPNATYFFQITSGSVAHLNSNGEPFSVTTGPPISNGDQTPQLVLGNILKEDGSSMSDDSIIYLNGATANGKSLPLSTFGKNNWIIPLNNLRDAGASRNFPITSADLINISVKTSSEGNAKLDVSGDASGQISDIVLDKTAPELGSVSTFTDSTKNQLLETGSSWLNHDSPYFEWQPATDSGYGTKGYYVYFGPKSDADPLTDPLATFQSGTSLSISPGLLVSSLRYFLLIKTVDNVDNVSDTNTTLIYRFDNQPPNVNINIEGRRIQNTPNAVVIATATDDATETGLLEFAFSLDGAELGAFTPNTSAPFTDLSEGNHTASIVARDLAGNVSAPSVINFTIDLTAPLITGLSKDTITASSANITWQTSEAATTQIKYGVDAASLDRQTAVDTVLSTFHGEALTGLNAETEYFFEATSEDEAGNITTETGSFTTLAIPTPSPTPEASPVPTPSPSPLPTPEASPSATPSPSPEGQPSPSPSPQPSPTPSPTPEPTPPPSLLPQITSFSPLSARSGQVVTVLGQNFGDTPGIVRFSGTSASEIKSWTQNKIEVIIDSKAVSGKITVQTESGKTAISSTSFILKKARITGTPPGPVFIGDEIEITGLDLGNGNGSFMEIDSQKATIISWTDTKITAQVPELDTNPTAPIKAVLPEEESNQLVIPIAWGPMTVNVIEKLYSLEDRESEVKIQGQRFISRGSKIINVKLGEHILTTQPSRDYKELVFNVPSGLPVGSYTITIIRGDSQTLTVPLKEFVVTKAGDFWKSDVTDTDEQVRDGKVTIEDVSRFLSHLWQKQDSVSLAEGDINFGPGDVSKDKIDIYDLNKIMANWDPE